MNGHTSKGNSSGCHFHLCCLAQLGSVLKSYAPLGVDSVLYDELTFFLSGAFSYRGSNTNKTPSFLPLKKLFENMTA